MENSITLLDTWVATLGVVDLPPTTLNFKIRECFLVCDVPGPDLAVRGAIHWHIGKEIPLPPGNWIILGWSDEITEEQAKGLVKSHNGEYLDYLENKPLGLYRCETALESFNSWLLSNGITERKLILKQVI